jgi:hypothetical protein
VTFAAPAFTHLRRLTDQGGLYEHAELDVPRPEHGYCVDDVARGLVVVCRPTGQGGVQHDLVEQYLRFVIDAQRADGAVVNRRGADLRWNGQACFEDCWGRALWGLGAVVASPADVVLREQALAAFEVSAVGRSPWTRSMVFAGLGAAEVLRVAPGHPAAVDLLRAAAAQVGVAATEADWPWPEARLRYANAALPEVLIAAGELLDDPVSLATGLALLSWLLEHETRDGHLSVTPVEGRGPGEDRRGGDQQPIEVVALADACARAHDVTGDRRWAAAVDLAASWFFGANDAGVWMADARTGAGYDGLQPHGRNENQGAESTLALISTQQQSRRLALCRM